eukprot:TRINITY_DN21974_c0_g2_i1.p1 TRINITY_DN21974_c0_g2~~TRINITY_DN21974_c0_g2_i1.p1  ORF type:complete len:232 (+),score=35.58 TRINITY_DN21974_c0_g2_i1:48-743(+)
MTQQEFFVNCDVGNAEAVKGNLEVGNCNVNEGSGVEQRVWNMGSTGLMLAARGGHSKVVELLVEHGADVKQVDAELWNALHYSAFSGHKDVSEILLAHGTPSDTRTMYEKATPLDFASHRRFTGVMKLLHPTSPPPVPYTPAEVTSITNKGLRKISDPLLHRYKVTPSSLDAWKGYLTSGAASPLSIPALDTLLNSDVTIHMHPTHPPPEYPRTIRRSSVSGLQHLVVCLR